jgi:hypothetical protein
MHEGGVKITTERLELAEKYQLYSTTVEMLVLHTLLDDGSLKAEGKDFPKYIGRSQYPKFAVKPKICSNNYDKEHSNPLSQFWSTVLVLLRHLQVATDPMYGKDFSPALSERQSGGKMHSPHLLLIKASLLVFRLYTIY